MQHLMDVYNVQASQKIVKSLGKKLQMAGKGAQSLFKWDYTLALTISENLKMVLTVKKMLFD